MPKEYDELRIRFLNVGHGQYFVLANGPVCAGALIDLQGARDFCAELNQLLREQFRLVPGTPETVESRLRSLGSDLGTLLLPQPIRDCLKGSKQGFLRIRFILPPELAGLPIEALRPPEGYLALDPMVSVVRSPVVAGSAMKRGPEDRDPRKPLKLIVAGAFPRGVDALGYEQEMQEISRVLTAATQSDKVEIDLVRRATREKLQTAVASAEGECAVMLMCHGEYDEQARQGVVMLERDDGSLDRVSEEMLAGALSAGPGVRLVVLSLCKGAQSNPYDPFSGVAGRLIGRGIPMAIAFQFQVSDLAAREFSRALINKITDVDDDCSVDEACAAWRPLGETRQTTIEWCTPMLHLHPECVQTYLWPLPPGEAATKTRSRKVALQLAHTNRIAQRWEETLQIAKGQLAKNPEVGPVHREAWVELFLVKACSQIAEQLAHDQSVDPDRVLGVHRWPSSEPDPLEPLRKLAATQGQERTQKRLEGYYRKAEEREVAGDFAGADEYWQGILEEDSQFRDAAARSKADLDVALSWDTSDAELVEPVFTGLRNAGFKVWFDRRRGEAPPPPPARARHVVLCLSDEYLNRRLPPPTEIRRTIPVVVRGPLKAPVPPRLRILPWIDLSDSSAKEEALRKLLAAVAVKNALPPFASPLEIQNLQRLGSPHRMLAGMKQHARDLYQFVYRKEIGTALPDDTAQLAERVKLEGKLPPEMQLHLGTIQRYAPLADVPDIGHASIEPAMQALYQLVVWVSRHYSVHQGPAQDDPVSAMWRRLAGEWPDNGRASLPNSRWELAEGRRQGTPPLAVYPGQQIEDGSAGNLLILPASPHLTKEVESLRALQEPSPLPLSESGEFDAGGTGNWRFVALLRPEGCTFNDLRNGFSPLPLSIALAAGRQVVSAFQRLHAAAPHLTAWVFDYRNLLFDPQGAAQVVWNWDAEGHNAAPNAWLGLRSALTEAIKDLAPAEQLARLAMAGSPEQALEALASDTPPPAEDAIVLQTAVECRKKNEPLPGWITDPPAPAAIVPPPPPKLEGFHLEFEVKLDCEAAWPLDGANTLVSLPDHVLAIVDAAGKTQWRDDVPMHVRRVASGRGLAVGGWKGELRWFSDGRLAGCAEAGWTIGDIRQSKAGWIAGAWNGRLELLEGGGSSRPLSEKAPVEGVHRLAVSEDRWAVLAMNGFVSVYLGDDRQGYPVQVPGALDLGFADGELVVLAVRGLVTIQQGKAKTPDKLPARGELQLLPWAAKDTCVVLAKSGHTWAINRRRTYPPGPLLPPRVQSVDASLSRSIAILDDGCFGYYRGAFKVRTWPDALAARISADGSRVVVVLPGRIEVYREDPE